MTGQVERAVWMRNPTFGREWKQILRTVKNLASHTRQIQNQASVKIERSTAGIGDAESRLGRQARRMIGIGLTTQAPPGRASNNGAAGRNPAGSERATAFIWKSCTAAGISLPRRESSNSVNQPPAEASPANRLSTKDLVENQGRLHVRPTVTLDFQDACP